MEIVRGDQNFTQTHRHTHTHRERERERERETHTHTHTHRHTHTHTGCPFYKSYFFKKETRLKKGVAKHFPHYGFRQV